MKVTQWSQFSGKEYTMELDIDQSQWDEWTSPVRYRKVQEIFPNLSEGEREFLLTGATPEEWELMWGWAVSE